MGPGRRRMVRRLHVHDGIITVVRRGPRWDHRGRYAGRGGRGGLRGGGQRARGAIEHARTCTMAPLSAFATDAFSAMACSPVPAKVPSRVSRYPQRCHRGYPGTRTGAIAGTPVPAKVPSRVSRYPHRCHRGYPDNSRGAIACTGPGRSAEAGSYRLGLDAGRESAGAEPGERGARDRGSAGAGRAIGRVGAGAGWWLGAGG